jgi:acyl-CoA thioester hydrolase
VTDAVPSARRGASAATEPDSYRFWIDEHVRFADLDTLGHVNNVAFTVYAESGRAAFMRHVGLWIRNAARETVVARLELDYRRELHYAEAIRVGVRVLKLGRSSFMLGLGLFGGSGCAATAVTVMVRVDRDSRQPVALSDDERAALAPYLDAGGMAAGTS